MHRFGGSFDLRLNGRDRGSEASLWPSFTDIMTVVLMVFMLTMVLVIVKNANLVERIRLSQELLAQAELEAAARVANAHDFVLGFPDGYDTVVGERGIQLSGGKLGDGREFRLSGFGVAFGDESFELLVEGAGRRCNVLQRLLGTGGRRP